MQGRQSISSTDLFVLGKIMVVWAVLRVQVSATSFPVSREITGKFWQYGAKSSFVVENLFVFSAAYLEIP
jgi:hypothetical protein